jgi:hypothetical protein
VLVDALFGTDVRAGRITPLELSVLKSIYYGDVSVMQLLQLRGVGRNQEVAKLCQDIFICLKNWRNIYAWWGWRSSSWVTWPDWGSPYRDMIYGLRVQKNPQQPTTWSLAVQHLNDNDRKSWLDLRYVELDAYKSCSDTTKATWIPRVWTVRNHWDPRNAERTVENEDKQPEPSNKHPKTIRHWLHLGSILEVPAVRDDLEISTLQTTLSLDLGSFGDDSRRLRLIPT